MYVWSIKMNFSVNSVCLSIYSKQVSYIYSSQFLSVNWHICIQQIYGRLGKLPYSQSACYCLWIFLLSDLAAEPHLCLSRVLHTPVGNPHLQIQQNLSFDSISETKYLAKLYMERWTHINMTCTEMCIRHFTHLYTLISISFSECHFSMSLSCVSFFLMYSFSHLVLALTLSVFCPSFHPCLFVE